MHLLSKVADSPSWNRVAAFFCGLMAIAMLIDGVRHGADFHVFYQAGSRLLKGLPIYQVEDDWMVYKYHPAWAVIFALFSFLPEKFSNIIFNSIQLLIWLTTAKIWAEWLGYDLKRPTNLFLLMIISLSALSAEIGYGQINGLLFYGATLLFVWLETQPQKYLRAGAAVALLMSLKLNFGLLIVYCCLKNIKSLLGFLIGLIGLHALVLLFSRDLTAGEIYGDWLRLLVTQSSNQFEFFEAQGFFRFFQMLLGPPGRIAWLLVLFGAIGMGVWFDRSRRLTPAWIAAYWIALNYLFSPLAWWYQSLFMFPAIFLLLKTPQPVWIRHVLVGCLIVYALITYNTLGHDGIIVFKQWQGFFICSTIVFALLAKSMVSRAWRPA